MAEFRRRVTARCLAVMTVVCLCACLSSAGCSRKAAEDPDAPARLLLHLRDLQQNQGYKELESLVDPGRARALIDTLMTMDRLLLAAAQLQQTAAQRLGPYAGVICDMSSLADYLGPFSRNVQIVSTRIDGDDAVVVYQVGERVPIERAHLRRAAGQWRYLPDEPDYSLPNLLGRLTVAMNDLRSQAEASAFSNEQAFIDEYSRQIATPLHAHLQEIAAQREQHAKAAATQP